jgi:hypothetical protein
VVTRVKIDLGENFGSSQLIKKNIDSGKRIFVLDGYCIERSVIHTQPQATIFRQRIFVLDGYCIERSVSTHSLKLPSFFLTKRAGQPQGEEVGKI